MFQLTVYRNNSPREVVTLQGDMPQLAESLARLDIDTPIDDWQVTTREGASDYRYTRALERSSGYFTRYGR